MPLLSKLIMQICMANPGPTCVEEMHICARDVFEINFFDNLTKEQEASLPYLLMYCRAEEILSYEE